jgi:hypothetical protein
MLEETAMLKVETFHTHHAGEAGANVSAAIASTTHQANATMTSWQQRGVAVNVVAAAAQLTVEGDDATYVLTVVADLHPCEEDEDERVTYEDAAFE